MESFFDIFKIGVGPSSSHTVGPMIAGFEFARLCSLRNISFSSIKIDLYGSLSLTGIGHKTDYAVLCGLMSFHPGTIDIELADERYNHMLDSKKININNSDINFDYEKDLVFHKKFLPEHSNTMIISAYSSKSELVISKKYYSVGGGNVLDESMSIVGNQSNSNDTNEKGISYNFSTAAELFSICKNKNIYPADVMFANERINFTESELRRKVLEVWDIMNRSIDLGLGAKPDVLPGGLNVSKRAPGMLKKLQTENISLNSSIYLNVYAIAVNEQNACGARVVTAPTNGAAGIIPALLRYYLDNNQQLNKSQKEDKIVNYLMSCAAIGALYKSSGSVSGAASGCQGEVGVACSMAAAGYCEILGGSLTSIEVSAEVAMEHNLGLTCDPIKGLVQVPCIERNAMGAVKALNAARIAYLDADSIQHIVGLDNVIKTMFEIGRDMNPKYKETSLGGLAVNVTVC